MTNREADQKLSDLKKDRAWLSQSTGYKMPTLYNAFSGEERELGERMATAFERAFLEEERRRNVDLTKPDASVWDLVYFNGVEIRKIDQAQVKAGYAKKEDLYHDASIDYCDRLLATPTPIHSHQSANHPAQGNGTHSPR